MLMSPICIYGGGNSFLSLINLELIFIYYEKVVTFSSGEQGAQNICRKDGCSSVILTSMLSVLAWTTHGKYFNWISGLFIGVCNFSLSLSLLKLFLEVKVWLKILFGMLAQMRKGGWEVVSFSDIKFNFITLLEPSFVTLIAHVCSNRLCCCCCSV